MWSAGNHARVSQPVCSSTTQAREPTGVSTPWRVYDVNVTIAKFRDSYWRTLLRPGWKAPGGATGRCHADRWAAPTADDGSPRRRPRRQQLTASSLIVTTCYVPAWAEIPSQTNEEEFISRDPGPGRVLQIAIRHTFPTHGGSGLDRCSDLVLPLIVNIPASTCTGRPIRERTDGVRDPINALYCCEDGCCSISTRTS